MKVRHTLAFTVLFLTASLLQAQDPPAAEAPKAPKTSQATGNLTVVDAAARMITLARGEASEQYRLGDQTEVLLNDEAGELGALQLDQRVRLDYLKDGEPPFEVRRISDDATIRVQAAERDGVAAKIQGIETRGEGEQAAQVLIAQTSQGKTRELFLRPEGANASVLMKNGQPATLADFAAGDDVTLSVRRTGGDKKYLKSIADPETYTAFLAARTLRGTISGVAEDGKSVTVTSPDEPQPVTVTLTRNTRYFKGGAKVDANPFQNGDEVMVKYGYRIENAPRATAVLTADSWRAYAQDTAALAAAKEKPAE